MRQVQKIHIILFLFWTGRVGDLNQSALPETYKNKCYYIYEQCLNQEKKTVVVPLTSRLKLQVVCQIYWLFVSFRNPKQLYSGLIKVST